MPPVASRCSTRWRTRWPGTSTPTPCSRSPGADARLWRRPWITAILFALVPVVFTAAGSAAAQRQGEAFAEYAAVDPAIAEAIAAGDDRLRGLLSQLVARAKHEGEIPGHLDQDHIGWAVLALMQGVAAQLSYQARTEEDVRTLVSYALERLLT